MPQDKEQTGVIDDAAGRQVTGVNQDVSGAAGQQDNSGAPGADEEKQGMLAAVQAERKARQQAEQELENLKQQMQLLQFAQMRGAMANPAQPGAVPVQEPDPFADEAQNLSDEDLMTVGMAKKYVAKIQQQQRQQELQMQVQQFRQQHADFDELVGTIDLLGTFKPSPLLQEVLREHPYLVNDLAQLPSAPIVAYNLAKQKKLEKELQEMQKRSQEHQTLQNAQAQTKPMPAAAAGTSSGASNQIANLDPERPEDRQAIYKLVDDMLAGKFG